MKLAYQAFDKAGKKVADTIEAATANDATENLRRQGLFVTQINPTAAGSGAGGVTTVDKGGRKFTLKADGKKYRKPGKAKQLRDMTAFSRQMFVLVSGGTPVVQALDAVERQSVPGGFREVLGDVRKRVEEGVPLSSAMEAHPQQFDTVCRSLVNAGETSGALGPMLERLAKLTQARLHIRNSIMGALVYPTLLIGIGIGVLILMLAFVLPRFSGLFATLDVPLPPTTKFLMTLSYVLIGYWWAVLIGIVGAVVGLKYWLATPAAQDLISDVMLRVPKLGLLCRNLTTARMARVLGVLVESKVPMLEALQLTEQSVGNRRYAKLLAGAVDAVTRGEPVSSAFGSSDLISPSIHEAIRNGEQNGQIGTLLLHVADFLDEENGVVIKSLTSVIEPLILLGLGVLVGFIAVSMFLPLFDLTSMVQGGGG